VALNAERAAEETGDTSGGTGPSFRTPGAGRPRPPRPTSRSSSPSRRRSSGRRNRARRPPGRSRWPIRSRRSEPPSPPVPPPSPLRSWPGPSSGPRSSASASCSKPWSPSASPGPSTMAGTSAPEPSPAPRRYLRGNPTPSNALSPNIISAGPCVGRDDRMDSSRRVGGHWVHFRPEGGATPPPPVPDADPTCARGFRPVRHAGLARPQDSRPGKPGPPGSSVRGGIDVGISRRAQGGSGGWLRFFGPSVGDAPADRPRRLASSSRGASLGTRRRVDPGDWLRFSRGPVGPRPDAVGSVSPGPAAGCDWLRFSHGGRRPPAWCQWVRLVGECGRVRLASFFPRTRRLPRDAVGMT